MTVPKPPRDQDAALARPAHTIVPAESVVARGGLVAFLSSARRAGAWTLPRHLRVVSALGNVELDLREACLAEGASEVELFACAGNVEVVVPPGVRVECDVDTFGASVEARGTSGTPGTPGAPGAPLVRIRGTAVFASVEIVVRAAGENGVLANVRRALRG